MINNAGGGIFSLLPQAAFPEPFERVFGTPHEVDLASIAAAHGLPYTRLESLATCRRSMAGEGLRIVEARTDRAANAELHARMREAAQDAVRASLRL